MNILIYSHAFAPSIGGVETIVMMLARGLAQATASESGARFDVTVVTQTPAGGFDDGALPFPVVRRPSLFESFALVRRADVLHLAGPALLPLSLGLLLRKPVVVEHHGYQAICPNGLLLYQPTQSACPGHFEAHRYQECWVCNTREHPWGRSIWMILSTFLRRSASKRVAANLAISRHVLGRLQLPRSEVSYYGIPNAGGDPVRYGSLLGREAPLTFGFVGRLVAEKGLVLLVQAAARLKSEGYVFRLKFVGEGPERRIVESAVRQGGLESEAQLVGFLTGDELAETLAGIDVVVMPSVMEETAGLAAIEHMMKGKLVIASEIGGLGEVVGDTGLKFRPGDVDSLADCMRRIIEHPELLLHFGRRARQRALELFTLRRMIEEHVGCYRRVTRLIM